MPNFEVLLADVSLVALAFVMLLIAKLLLDKLTPFRIDDQLTAKDNPAFGLSLCGYYVGVLIVITGAAYGEGDPDIGLLQSLALDGLWALIGIVLLNISRLMLDKLVLPKFSTRKEIVEDRNLGMGAIEFGTYVGSALVIAGAISGEGSYSSAAIFYALGQVALIVLAKVYDIITSYSLHDEIEKDNVAAGVAYAGNIIAMGILLMRGSSGDLYSLDEVRNHAIDFGYYFIAAVLLVVVGRVIIDALLLPKRTLAQEIAEDRNVAAGLLEGGVLVAFAGLMFFVV